MEHADPEQTKTPAHEETYRRLRDMVMFGELEPGQKVTIQGLIADLGAGMTPVREALRRLGSEGALERHGNRRVSVPLLTQAQLAELEFARLALEPKLAALALARMTSAQIDAVEALDAALDVAIKAGDVRGYLAGNYRFHFAIYAAAEAPILLSLTQSLWLRFGPSLRVFMAEGEVGAGPDHHKAAIAALRTGDEQALDHAIRADIEQGLSRVRREQGAG